MVDQVHITGFDAAALKALTTAMSNSLATVSGGSTMPGRKPALSGRNNKDPLKATAASLDRLGDAADGLTSRFGRLNRSIAVVSGRLNKMSATLKGKTTAAQTNSTGIDKKAGEAVADLGQAATALGSPFAKLAAKTIWLGGTFAALRDFIQGPVVDVFNDYYALQRRGISASNNLVDFYIAAGKAGMSLAEYTQLIEGNIAVVSRASSFKAFNDRLESSADALAELGVFGGAARNLTATMMTGATTLGVPQKQMGGVIQDQIKTFKTLRDVTGMTAAGFQQLVEGFSRMEEVQGQLLGMAPDQREAARKDLFNTYTLGQTMGMTAQASERLGAALLAQRRMTAVERFKAQGAVRQAGAIVGMGAAQTEELARLSAKKNRSAEENKRFIELGSQLQQGLEAMQNSGNIQAEHIADQLGGILPNAEQLKAAGEAKLTTDSGAAQKNFTDTLSKTEQTIGKLATAIEGLQKSPIWQGLLDIGKIAAAFVGGLALKKAMGGVAGKTVAAGVEAGAKAPGMLSKVGGFLGSYGQEVKSTASLVGKGPAAISVALDGVSAVAKAFKFLGPAAAVATAAIGGVKELWTGEMAKQLGMGDGIFGRLYAALLAGVNTVVGGLTGVFDDAINWLFKGLGINFTVNTTKMVDMATILVSEMWRWIAKSFLRAAATMLGSVTSIFGLDAPFVKSMNAEADAIEKGLEESAKTRKELWETDGATLKSMGEKQAEGQKVVAEKLEASAAKISTAESKTVMGMESLASAALSTAQAAQVATPGPTARSTVTPPEVNKAQVEDKKEAVKTTAQVDSMAAVLTVLQQQLDVAKQQLLAMTGKKEEPAIQLSRPTFQSTADMTNTLFGLSA